MLEAVAVEIPNTGGSGVVVLRVPASRRTHRLQSKDKSAAPDPTNTPNPTKDKSAIPNPTKDKSAAPDPIKGKARWWMSGGIIFSLTALAIIVGWSLGSAPPVPPVPQKEENLADKYANMTEQQLINSLPENYKSELVYLEQGNRWSAAVSIKTRAEAVASDQLAQHGVNFSGQGQRTDPKILVIIDAIIKLEEHTRPYISGQGNTYLANKQYDLAIQKFDEAISLGDTKLYYNRGLAWLAKHEYERAIADFTQAAKFEHGNHFIYIRRAEANEQKGDRDSAIADYRRALALAPDLTVADQIKAALKRLASARN
jgi:hypothetical protein